MTFGATTVVASVVTSQLNENDTSNNLATIMDFILNS